MRPVSRLAVAALTLCAALAPAAAAQAPPPPRLAPGTPAPKLAPERFAAIDAALTALIPTELEDPSAEEIAAADQACRAMIGQDVLLVRYSNVCRADVLVTQESALAATCASRKGCRRVIARARDAMAFYLAEAKRLNRILPAQVPDAGCARALQVRDGELRSVRRLSAAYGQLAEALRIGSRKLLARAQKRFDKITNLPDDSRNRKRLRAACR